MTDAATYALWTSGLLPVEKYRTWIRSMFKRKEINWHDALLHEINEGGMTTNDAARYLLKVYDCDRRGSPLGG